VFAAVITLMQLNGLNLYGSLEPAEQERFARLEALVRDRGPDVLAVQEIIAKGDDAEKRRGAVEGVRRLAEATGLCCEVSGEPAVAVGGVFHHTAVLWKPGIEPVPGTLRTLTRSPAGMWHCATAVVLDVGGPLLRAGSVQLSPFDQVWAIADAKQLTAMFNVDATAGFAGGDYNGIGATQVITGEDYVYYDHNPYVGRFAPPWHPDHGYQFDEEGNLDRRAAIRLEHPRLGAMRDCAVLAGSPWTPTTGFHRDDRHPPRRVDRWYATNHVPDGAVTASRVVDRDAVKAVIAGVEMDLTDHLPTEIDVDEHALAA
jgi:hypothetical protein